MARPRSTSFSQRAARPEAEKRARQEGPMMVCDRTPSGRRTRRQRRCIAPATGQPSSRLTRTGPQRNACRCPPGRNSKHNEPGSPTRAKVSPAWVSKGLGAEVEFTPLGKPIPGPEARHTCGGNEECPKVERFAICRRRGLVGGLEVDVAESITASGESTAFLVVMVVSDWPEGIRAGPAGRRASARAGGFRPCRVRAARGWDIPCPWPRRIGVVA